jgi:hypothetical protein
LSIFHVTIGISKLIIKKGGRYLYSRGIHPVLMPYTFLLFNVSYLIVLVLLKFGMNDLTPIVAAEWSPLLLRIREVPGSRLGPKTGFLRLS